MVIQFKIFLQELCQAKIDWDEALPADLMEGWSTLSGSLQYAQPLSVPQCYLDAWCVQENQSVLPSVAFVMPLKRRLQE